jgi:twitching motility protein PilT
MDIHKYFQAAIDRCASDVHIIAGAVPVIRVSGDLVRLENSPVSNEELRVAVLDLVGERAYKTFELKKEHDIAVEYGGFRFRLNLHHQEGSVAIAARLVPSKPPSPSDAGLSETIYKLTHLKDGLVLVTGPTGCGKSTTLASMINVINQERRCHIVTIEDPIEYLFQDEQSVIEQRELGSDTYDFATALRSALRQDPNVIMVGEMRDLETISASVTAAETGHLVLSTLHTTSAIETIQRIVDAYPSQQHQQILNQLSMTLRAVVSQHLIPQKNGSLGAAREILINTRAVANLIRSNQLPQIYSIMQSGLKSGMMTMNKAIELMLAEGKISEDVARNRRRDLETLAVYY